MANYYNEWDGYAAQWLRNLIDAKLIPAGDVDTRSIEDVHPDDLRGYTQCHFFAGIAGWSLALKMAGWPEDKPVWTGSPPCQPFSTAGKQLGANDDRHLAPHFLGLAAAVRPPVLFGEQVAAAVRKDAWLDDLLDALEREGYSTGAAVSPACSVGSPHRRQRLWFAATLADTCRVGQPGQGRLGRSGNPKEGEDREINRVVDDSGCGGVADADSERHNGVYPLLREGQKHLPETTGRSEAGGLAYGGRPSPLDCPWRDADWLLCRDGKWRAVESGTFPLAHGVPSRVGRLRAYGNAIVPQVAAQVIRAFMMKHRP